MNNKQTALYLRPIKFKYGIMAGCIASKLTSTYPITPEVNRVITKWMVEVKLWEASIDLFGLIIIKPTKAKLLLNFMKKHQQVDNLKHAPCCPANHFHRMRLVFRRCTCGANVEMRN